MNILSHSDIALVEASFRRINRCADHAASLFFARLFEFQPVLRSLAPGTPEEQKREFIRLMGTIVHRLECFDLVRDHIRELAQEHPELCAHEENHMAFGAALFWMLEKILGTSFTPQLYGAWMTLFQTLSKDLTLAVRDCPHPLAS